MGRQRGNGMKEKILVVDDEQSIVDILEYNLKREGYQVVTAGDGLECLLKFEIEEPDLVLLDVMMPEMNGFEVLRRVRERSNVPVIILTARAEEVDTVLGLELGADDYVSKPFSIRELMARVRTNLHRTAVMHADTTKKEQDLTAGDIRIDAERYEVSKRGQVIELTLRELELLKFLMNHRGQVFSREDLLEKVWGYEYYGDVRTVDVTIRRLREKIEDVPSAPEYILTRRGIGYYFSEKA